MSVLDLQSQNTDRIHLSILSALTIKTCSYRDPLLSALQSPLLRLCGGGVSFSALVVVSARPVQDLTFSIFQFSSGTRVGCHEARKDSVGRPEVGTMDFTPVWMVLRFFP